VFPNQNCLKQGAALLPWLFTFTLGNTIMKIQENQKGMEFNGTHQLFNVLMMLICLTKTQMPQRKSTGILLDANRKVGLE
jgi:hypothetical protein